MALQFTRNAKVYVELLSAAGGTRRAIWQIGVLTGFSFSQTSNTSEVTVSEAGTTSRRAGLTFTDSLAPVEWSFSTYARPKSYQSLIRCPEEPLWAMLMGADDYDYTSPFTGEFYGNGSVSPNKVNTCSAGSNIFGFSQSNISSLSDKWQIWFAFEDGTNKQYYKLPKAVVNSCTMDFDIEGITTIQWSGSAAQVVDAGTSQSFSGALNTAILSDTTTFIRNRLSTVTMTRTDSSPDKAYTVVLTGGSFTIENNVNYLTPEELGRVNIPLGNITGTRKISGNMTCYLDNVSTKSGGLFGDLVADTSTVRNVFTLALKIGGATGNRVQLDLPTAYVQVPAIGVEDLITLDVGFAGQVQGGNIDSTNEATVTYYV